jgi:hypothetical protein
VIKEIGLVFLKFNVGVYPSKNIFESSLFEKYPISEKN